MDSAAIKPMLVDAIRMLERLELIDHSGHCSQRLATEFTADDPSARSPVSSGWTRMKTTHKIAAARTIYHAVHAGRALLGVVVGELYASTAGIGHMIAEAGNTFDTDTVFLGVLLFTAAGLAITLVLSAVELHFERWRPRGPSR